MNLSNYIELVEQRQRAEELLFETQRDIKTIATQRDEFRGRLKRATELLVQLDEIAEFAVGDHGRYNYDLGKKVEELRFTLRSGMGEGEHKK